RRAQSLLEDVVDAGEALDRFVQQEQGYDKTGEFSGAHAPGLDLRPRVRQQTYDGDSREELDQRRCHCLLRDVAQIAASQAFGAVPETVGLDFLGAEGLHYLVAAQRFLEDLIELRGVV